MLHARVLLCCLALLSAPALAADNPSTSPAIPAPEKKICRSSGSTGSFMTKRICRTKAEWAAIDAANAQMTGETLDQRNRAGADGGR